MRDLVNLQEIEKLDWILYNWHSSLFLYRVIGIPWPRILVCIKEIVSSLFTILESAEGHELVSNSSSFLSLVHPATKSKGISWPNLLTIALTRFSIGHVKSTSHLFQCPTLSQYGNLWIYLNTAPLWHHPPSLERWLLQHQLPIPSLRDLLCFWKHLNNFHFRCSNTQVKTLQNDTFFLIQEQFSAHLTPAFWADCHLYHWLLP